MKLSNPFAFREDWLGGGSDGSHFGRQVIKEDFVKWPVVSYMQQALENRFGASDPPRRAKVPRKKITTPFVEVQFLQALIWICHSEEFELPTKWVVSAGDS